LKKIVGDYVSLLISSKYMNSLEKELMEKYSRESIWKLTRWLQ